jgi:hypothetical protein
MAVALGLVTGAGAWFEKLPYTVLSTCGFVVFVAGVFLVKVRAFYMLLKNAAPKSGPSENWRHVPYFFLSQAALLIAGIEPFDTPQVPPGAAVPLFMALQGAITSGEIERIPDPQYDQFNTVEGIYRPGIGTKISREAFQRFANKRNLDLAFLDG